MFAKRQMVLASATAFLVWPWGGSVLAQQQFDRAGQLAQATSPQAPDEGRQPNQKQPPPKGAQQQPNPPKAPQPAQPKRTQQGTPGGVQQPSSQSQEMQHRPPTASPPPQRAQERQPPAQPPKMPQAQERRPETSPPRAPVSGASPQPPNPANARPAQPQTTQQQAPRGVQPTVEPNQTQSRPGQPQTTQQAPRAVQPTAEPNQTQSRPGQPQTTQQAPRGVQPTAEPNQTQSRPGQPQTTQQAPTGVQPTAEPNQTQSRPGQPQTTQQAPRGVPPMAAPNQTQQQLGLPATPQRPLTGPARMPNTAPGSQQRMPVPAPAAQQASPPQIGAQKLDQLRQERHERVENNGQRTVIEEPGHTIIVENGHAVIRHDETERFRVLGGDIHVEQRAGVTTTVVRRPDNVQIVTIVDPNGRLLRRVRRMPDGREFVLIDNRPRPGVVVGIDSVVLLPPLRLAIPREEYIVDTEELPPQRIVEVLEAPPLERLERAYTLDEIRYSMTLRDRMRRVDLNTINFETGSWQLEEDQGSRLTAIAEAVGAVIRRNPNEMFLIEGHTDAIGSDVDNLSLSDRRAESVALVLTQNFQVPPENLTTQGYGAHELKVQTMEPSRENRRVTIRRITPLLAGSQ
jgi:outer membrane protein OmpA-like peptidoglycan-associated protein